MYEYSPCIAKKKILITVAVALFLFQYTWGQVGWGQDIPDNPLIGLNVPLSGAYKAQGNDQVNAFEMAINTLNEQGGVLGKEVSYKIKDTETNPQVAKKNTLQFINKDNVELITGGISSGVALTQSDICQQENMLFMCPIAHSTAVTGFEGREGQYGDQKAHRHTFRWFFNAWMTQEALTPYLLEEFGKLQNYFYITADNAWGRSTEHAIRQSIEAAGCNTLGRVKARLGQGDLSRELKKAQNADPDVLMLILFGSDMVKAINKLYQMGLDQEMQIVVPLMELNMAHEIGPEKLEGIISTTNWYWGLKDKYPGSRKFVRKYRSKYNKPPGFSAAGSWTVVKEWAAAVERAGSFAPDKVIKELEGHQYQVLKGKETWRSWDHQAVNSAYIVEGKSKKNMENEWDLLKILKEVDGTEVVRSKVENPVMLEPLDSE